ncbi:hypothetical protein C8K30_1011063 [Promicromonospora sp. AC04]|uniref:hypothetical protein n=1 Tax=Promicromonospora sp. AC04 TaxID=2135723 RepID=UPI000D474075|nr:hypothetical protein [Promicromonospora sp. AC04]PUB32537.1 hypothetical protein C8K30_1011063 [Promicromonospora sp. AC04]
MAFLERIGFVETVDQEQARLAAAPAGSINYCLSTLPVTISGWPQDLLIELPWIEPRTDRRYRVVVVPIEYRRDALPDGVDQEPLPRRRHPGSWTCAVVSSDHPSYPVGGQRIVVSGAELARGKRIELR